MYAAAFSEWASTGLTTRSVKWKKGRRITDSTKKTGARPVLAKAPASHSAPFIEAASAISSPPAQFSSSQSNDPAQLSANSRFGECASLFRPTRYSWRVRAFREEANGPHQAYRAGDRRSREDRRV